MQFPEKIQKLKHSPNTAEREAAALRAELQIELHNKKQCSYQPYECTQLSLDGYNYCLKHILNDKNAPFKQCCYVYTSNSKRCPQAAPKTDKKDFGYCNEHALQATLARNRQNCKYPAPHSAEVLLHSLSHYVKKPRIRSSASTSAGVGQHDDSQNNEEGELKATKSLDPFSEIDVTNQLNASSTDGIDLCSDSESDVDASTVASVWHDYQADSSDNESIDSENEDYLKHANVFTADEITMVTKEKLVRLQALYIEQYRHLQYILKERRRKYVHALKREKETCCNIYNQVRDNAKEQRLYKKLKAYNKYHKTHGQEAILSKRAHDLRTKINEGMNSRTHNFTKCSFSEGGVKCGEKALPLARHCRKHILEDPNQVLFRPCGKVRGDVECTTPVEAIFDDTTCNLHMDMPCLRSYSQPRKDSDSDYDDSLETSNIQHNLTDLSTTCNVKTELIDYNLPPEIPKMHTVPTLLFEENSITSDTKIKEEVPEDETFTKYDKREIHKEPFMKQNIDVNMESAPSTSEIRPEKIFDQKLVEIGPPPLDYSKITDNFQNVSSDQNMKNVTEDESKNLAAIPEDATQISEISASIECKMETIEPKIESTANSKMEGTKGSSIGVTTESNMEGTVDSNMEGTTEKNNGVTAESSMEGTTDSNIECTTESNIEGTTELKIESTDDSNIESTIDSKMESEMTNPEDGAGSLQMEVESDQVCDSHSNNDLKDEVPEGIKTINAGSNEEPMLS